MIDARQVAMQGFGGAARAVALMGLTPAIARTSRPRIPDRAGTGYDRGYSRQQHLIPIQFAPDSESDEEEIILALLMEIATYVV